MNHVLIANRFALPVLLDRLSGLAGGRLVVLVQRPDTGDPVALWPVHAEIHWVSRDFPHPFALNEALRGLHLPQGQTQAWVACSSAEARLIRRQLIEDHGVSSDHIECVFYASASRRSSAATESGLKPAMM